MFFSLCYLNFTPERFESTQVHELSILAKDRETMLHYKSESNTYFVILQNRILVRKEQETGQAEQAEGEGRGMLSTSSCGARSIRVGPSGSCTSTPTSA
jgi:hypothetical protein